MIIYLFLEIQGIYSITFKRYLGNNIKFDVVERTYYHMFPAKKSKTVNALNQLK